MYQQEMARLDQQEMAGLCRKSSSKGYIVTYASTVEDGIEILDPGSAVYSSLDRLIHSGNGCDLLNTAVKEPRLLPLYGHAWLSSIYMSVPLICMASGLQVMSCTQI